MYWEPLVAVNKTHQAESLCSRHLRATEVAVGGGWRGECVKQEENSLSDDMLR